MDHGRPGNELGNLIRTALLHGHGSTLEIGNGLVAGGRGISKFLKFPPETGGRFHAKWDP